MNRRSVSDQCGVCKKIVSSEEFKDVIYLLRTPPENNEKRFKKRKRRVQNAFDFWENRKKSTLCSYGQLAISSQKGCSICGLIYSAVRKQSQRGDSKNGLNTHSHLQPPLHTDTSLFYVVGFGDHQNARARDATLSLGVNDTYVTRIDISLPTKRELDKIEGPPQHSSQLLRACTVNQIAQWIHDCEHHHIACNQSFLNYRYACNRGASAEMQSMRPKRLIHLMNAHRIAVRETATLPDHVRYATLSHCWGENPERWKVSVASNGDVDMATTPKILNDAMKLLRELDFAYLWVDALCIDQNSIPEWLAESEKMGAIFQHAKLNVSALAARHGNQDLFQKPDEVMNLLLSVPCDSGETPVLLSISLRDKWIHQIGFSKLYSRGWVLQERVLSPRILHIGKGELFWDCIEYRTTDLGPTDNNINAVIESLSLRDLVSRRQPPVLSPQSRAGKAYRTWHDIVTAYSGTQLTKASEKLVAISGLANRVAENSDIDPGDYVAGLWKATLNEDLLWCVDGRQCFPERAPSWSWARWDGVVTFADLGYTIHHTRILNVSVPRTSPGSGRIALQGPLTLLYLDDTVDYPEMQPFKHSPEEQISDIDVTAPSMQIPARKLKWDCSDTQAHVHQQYYLLWMASSPLQPLGNQGLCYGLVLKPTGFGKTQFERVGRFCSRVKSFEHRTSRICRACPRNDTSSLIQSTGLKSNLSREFSLSKT